MVTLLQPSMPHGASPVPMANSGCFLLFVGSKALSSVLSLWTWKQPASVLSKICVRPRAQRQALGMPLSRKVRGLGYVGKQMLSKGQECRRA